MQLREVPKHGETVDTSAWLRALGLSEYEGDFRSNNIDGDLLPTLTDQDLRELGVVSLGHRKRLLGAISALSPLTSQAPPQSNAPAQGGERRHLTVMFIDLVGSTELAGRLDPEDLRDLIGRYHTCCSDHVAVYAGYIAKYMGDGVLAYFGWPSAHEHAAERAVRAALAIGEAVADLRAPDGSALAARVGIATGPVVVGDLIGSEEARERAVVGECPNLAARLQALADPGSVVIAHGTRDLLGDLFTLLDLGPVSLKGFAQPVRAWRVVGEGTAEGRFEAMHTGALPPQVGREHETALLLDHWDQAKNGQGQVILLGGEPGIGKSRLVSALREQFAGEPHTTVSQFCSPHHANTALHPITGLLRRAAGLRREDSVEEQLNKVEVMLARAIENVTEVAPIFADLLAIPYGSRYAPVDLSPPEKKERTFHALSAQLRGLAAQQPVIAIYEDLHWADPSTLELLGRTIEQVQHLPVLLIATFRPEFIPPWTGYEHVKTLSLVRLARRQGGTLIERVTGGKPLPVEVLEQILARTDGVPLFVEELTKAVLESGLVSVVGDRYELSGPLPPLAIPATLHDSLMARLDRLAPSKQVAQIGAVIGREFTYELLASVAGLPDLELEATLEQLAQSELIFQRGTPPDATYTFKHALVRDAAYQSLLRSRHLQLHAQIAETLEQRFPETGANEPEVLARHYTAAGLAEKAVPYWERAGARASERSAYMEAISHYRKGLELVTTLSRQDGAALELPLQMGLGDALSWTRGFAAPEVEAAYNRAHELLQGMGDSFELFRILWGLWHFLIIRADFDRAQALSDELSRLGERLRDESLVPHIRRTRSETHLWRGEFSPARQEAANLPAAGSPIKPIPGVQDPLIMCGLWESKALWHLGYPDSALERVNAVLDRAKGSGQSGDIGAALIVAAWVRLWRRETAEAYPLAERALQFNAEHGYAFHVAMSEVLLGSLQVYHSQDASGLARIRGGIAGISATGAGVFLPNFFGLLAEASALLGDHAGASAALQEAESRISESGERWSEAEIYRLKGELYVSMRGNIGEAERCFRRSIEVARSQQARSLELRAATSLARFLCDEGRHREARYLLTSIYEGFTEGFSTHDLSAGKALLDAIR